MKLQFKHQQFQADAVQAVVDVFAGQPFGTETYKLEISRQIELEMKENLTANSPFQISREDILNNVQKVQRKNNLPISEKLEGEGVNLTIEMETGVGKTYTYIKTMYELNRRYGWSKFIVIVPSVAIREGVYKTFQTTQEHFAQEYKSKINFFIYNSARLGDIKNFAQSNGINAMIINAQAFNARGQDARRIRMNLDEFNSIQPIDVIAGTNPVLIIDEPQSVEGAKTKEGLKDFKPLITLRYSATHRELYNLVYRLDAVDAYNQKLVKRISVCGIKTTGTTAASGYVYFDKINKSEQAPTAAVWFDFKTKDGIKRKSRNVGIGFNLYEASGRLDEYRDNFIVKFIDGRNNSLEFLNGVKLFAGDVIGNFSESQLRKIQIRETIKAHLDKEAALFARGIKVLSLFFIDEVAHYKIYDAEGSVHNGDFADWFEDEYKSAVEEKLKTDLTAAYKNYLAEIPAAKTHAGYFSIDKKGRLTDGKISDRAEKTSDDIGAYDLIMKNKELLLDIDPHKSPVRFIFSHSALREGWDNPNVFQICTLKQSGSDIRKRQEVGRGLRLCVNQNGERMDGGEVYDINKLTMIVGESYDDFTRKLQSEIADTVIYRPRKVDIKFFENNKFDSQLADKIWRRLYKFDYIDDNDTLTDKYFDDKKNNSLDFGEVNEHKDAIVKALNKIYGQEDYKVENAKDTVEIHLDKKKFTGPAFKKFWEKISAKTIYSVDFETDELVSKIVDALNEKLFVQELHFQVEKGDLENSGDGTAFNKTSDKILDEKVIVEKSAVKYDVIAKLMKETDLSRKTLAKIIGGLNEKTFAQLSRNLEEFVMKSSKIINAAKKDFMVDKLSYSLTGEHYDDDIFTDKNLSGAPQRTISTPNKNLFSGLIFDSEVEKKFATDLETADDVEVYAKLPRSFSIATPVGAYNPDWAVVFREGNFSRIYFVAETKGNSDEETLRNAEKFKIKCAKKHFNIVDAENIGYETVTTFEELRTKADL